MTKMTIGEKIKFHRKRLGLTLVDLDKLTGIDNGNLSRIENGKQGVTEANMLKIASVFKMDISELVRDITDFSAGDSATIPIYSPFAGSANIRELRDFEKTSDISFAEVVVVNGIKIFPNSEPKWEVDKDQKYVFSGDTVSQIASNPKSIVAVEVKDEAMNPRLFKTDLVLLDTSDTKVTSSGGMFAIITDEETVVVRRMYQRAGHGLLITCDNQQYPSFTLTQEEARHVTIIGRAKAMRGFAGL